MSHLLRATTLALFSFCAFIANAKNDITQPVQPVIETKQGAVRGGTEKGVLVWKGIRFAEAERFKAPQAPRAWTGVKDALEFGPVAPQTKSGLSTDGPQSEDCLSLNIWSPAADGKKRPVMFWIHGGGFVIGAGSSDLY
ncbi:MAG TPA: carboxylesterase family protein, partial [Chitinophagales bacterium]|nr:carboxylesterase family protein [Chitinophagales bacterium]